MEAGRASRYAGEVTRTPRAMIMAAGFGTRLGELSELRPKPMLPVAGVPFTVHQIARARDAGVTRIVLATSYRADVFREFIDAADLGIACEPSGAEEA